MSNHRFGKVNYSINITKVEEGKEYQKDDVYLLIGYEKDMSHDYWLVKVFFEDNIIHCIEISKPKGGLKLTAVD